jgi:hypothetical protein
MNLQDYNYVLCSRREEEDLMHLLLSDLSVNGVGG